ncbi:lichenicidin A2 family type 2 lantibiotic [Staphylococcus schweitzeri]|uniref:lichenicidin A2 family type 2 lantibiotic n=1 Tax=Staphylococcus schweitzeri TaxID=1654388 RepID=UPI0005080B5B|nr:lichenicidin A2 family type 2 lantibiotic [Staphylococcus schweitzeri]CDR52649.1 type 2 lantibiotic%2C SP_1948 family [Staphylococcus schweitzeri]
MLELKMKEVVGEAFEDLSISEMTLVQGSGDMNGEFTTSPACVYSAVFASRASSKACVGGLTAVSGAALSALKC